MMCLFFCAHFENLKTLNFFLSPLIWLDFKKKKKKNQRLNEQANQKTEMKCSMLTWTIHCKKTGVSITATGVSASDTNWKASWRVRGTKKSHLKCNTRWLMIQYFIIKNTFLIFFFTLLRQRQTANWTALNWTEEKSKKKKVKKRLRILEILAWNIQIIFVFTVHSV